MFKGRKKWIFRVVVVVLLAMVLFGGYEYIKITYTINEVYVEGNYHYTNEEIKDIVMKGPLGDNSLYLSMKYKKGGVKNIPFIDEISVDILSPETIKITVYEKALAGYIKYMDTNMYFDKDGYVVETSKVKTLGIPQINGLKFDHAVLGEQLPVENKEIFAQILSITKLMNKYELPAEVILFKPNNEVMVVFGNIKVSLGNEAAHLEDKMMILPELLEKLTDKKGTLHMEVYDASRGRYTFLPEN